MKTIGFGDTEIDKEGAEELREEMIELRDEALAQGDMNWAVRLSHVVAFMANAITEIWPDSKTIAERMQEARETSHPAAYINKVEFDEPFAQAAVEKLRKDLAWKGPTGRTQAVVALPRELAEALLDAIGARHA
jgi:hypothetical protein